MRPTGGREENKIKNKWEISEGNYATNRTQSGKQVENK